MCDCRCCHNAMHITRWGHNNCLHPCMPTVEKCGSTPIDYDNEYPDNWSALQIQAMIKMGKEITIDSRRYRVYVDLGIIQLEAYANGGH